MACIYCVFNISLCIYIFLLFSTSFSFNLLDQYYHILYVQTSTNLQTTKFCHQTTWIRAGMHINKHPDFRHKQTDAHAYTHLHTHVIVCHANTHFCAEIFSDTNIFFFKTNIKLSNDKSLWLKTRGYKMCAQ